jgi:ferritin
MISDKMQEAINKQINAEIYSAYLYLSMSAYFETVNLPGAAGWMRCQAQEEMLHAMKFFGFMNERGGTVTLTAIEGPPTTWTSTLAVFQDVYDHERKVTALINELMDTAIEDKDHAANVFLQWFVTEQVEEEATADGIVQQLKLAGNGGAGLFMIDRELGARVFTPPVDLE